MAKIESITQIKYGEMEFSLLKKNNSDWELGFHHKELGYLGKVKLKR